MPTARLHLFQHAPRTDAQWSRTGVRRVIRPVWRGPLDLVLLRARLFVAVALCIGGAVSITGAIGFIGLVVPHLLRPLVGYQPGRLLVASALGGAAMLLGTDIVVRLMPPGPEIKIGVLTAIVGAPFFLFLIPNIPWISG